jgi:hypothetical protein
MVEKRNPEHRRKREREYKARQKADDPVRYEQRTRRVYLKSAYGITPEEYDKILESQSGVCGICKLEQATTARQYRLYVDHDHRTGQIRGLLCHTCNLGLGHFKDQIPLLQNATDYLRKYSIH